MWKVITSVGGSLGVYGTAEQAMAVAKEYNRKGNRPGIASVSMYGKSTGDKKKKDNSGKSKKSKGFMDSSSGVNDYPDFGDPSAGYPDFEVY